MIRLRTFLQHKVKEADFGSLPSRIAAYTRQKRFLLPEDLSTTAERLGTDPSTLCKYYRQVLHTDFRSWRTQARIEEAKRLLIEAPDLPICKIGYLVGFEKSNFTRQFRLSCGLTPTQWRRLHQPISPDEPGAADPAQP